MALRAAPVELPEMQPSPGHSFGVYVHVPFCITRCGYCDFNTYTPAELGGVNPDAWLLALRSRAGAGRRTAGRTDGEHGVRRRWDTVAAGRCAPGHAAGHGARALRAGAGRRDHHRGEPRVDLAGILRRHPGGRLHPGVAGHAVGGAASAGDPRPRALARAPGRRRPRGDGRGFRTRQPGPDLRHPGRIRRRSAAFGRRGRRDRGRSRLRVLPAGRAGHRPGPPGPQR